ncbi:hypothetical protein D3C81_1861390 [compost metagenome]
MGLGINGKTADAPYRIGLARSVFVDHKQVPLILGQGQPGRVFAADHLQGDGVDLPGGVVERQTVNPLARACRVRTHEQFDILGHRRLYAHGANAAGHQQRPEITHRYLRLRRRCRHEMLLSTPVGVRLSHR